MNGSLDQYKLTLFLSSGYIWAQVIVLQGGESEIHGDEHEEGRLQPLFLNTRSKCMEMSAI